jgi:hypothetical protein
MSNHVIALLFAIGCPLLSLILSGASANKAGREWMASLRHPDNAFMLKIMPIIGFAFYGFFGLVLYHMVASGYVLLAVLVVAVILVNGVAAFLLYKTKRFKPFFVFSLLLPILLIIIVFLLIRLGSLLAIIPAVYCLWLIYDFSYFYRLMKMN